MCQASAFVLCFGFTHSAFAQAAGTTTDDAEEDADEATHVPALSLRPGTPQVAALPGGTTPAFGSKPANNQDWRFDFHGFLSMPLRAGINKRDNPVEGQSGTVLHAPPVVPDDLGSFNYTGIVPRPYTQLNFSYGNSVVTGNVFLVARSTTNGAGFFDPPSQAGINDAFLNFNIPNLARNTHLEINVGAFSNRYGAMGEYDEGRYGTPLFGRTNGAGENIVGRFVLGDWAFALEQGFQAQADKPPNALVPEGWNNFADPNVGASLVTHWHAGINYKRIATLGLHYLTSWSQDDRAAARDLPDGRITVLGADLRLTLRRFGHLYLGVSPVDARDSRVVGRILEILNANGGPGLMQNYFGPKGNGTGKLLTVALQYDLSLARLLRYPEPFVGDGPDIFVSIFGMQTHVQSADAAFDGITKRKLGAEASYSLLPWLAVSARYDRVEQNVDDPKQTFAILSPRVIFRSNWQAQDQVVIQYSRFLTGSNVVVRDGYPPKDNPNIRPDEDMIAITGTMWW